MGYYDQQGNYIYDASDSQDQAISPSAYQYDSYSWPLARGVSSGGSSTASTVPESPMPSDYYSAQQHDPAYQQGPAYLQDSTYQDPYYSTYSAGSEDTYVPRGDGYVCPSPTAFSCYFS